MVIIDINELFLHFLVIKVDRLDHIWIPLQYRVTNMQHRDHRLPKNRIALGSNEVKRYFKHLWLANVRYLDLDLDVHKPATLHNFLEFKFTVGAVRQTVVASDHGT